MAWIRGWPWTQPGHPWVRGWPGSAVGPEQSRWEDSKGASANAIDAFLECVFHARLASPCDLRSVHHRGSCESLLNMPGGDRGDTMSRYNRCHPFFCGAGVYGTFPGVFRKAQPSVKPYPLPAGSSMIVPKLVVIYADACLSLPCPSSCGGFE